MSSRSRWIATVFILCAMRTWAVPVHLSFDWPASTPASADAKVHIYAVRMAGTEASAAPVQADSGPDGTILNLDEGVWLVQAFAPGYWTEGAEVTAGGQAPSAARLAFWPASSLQGGVTPAPSETLPRTIDVKLYSHSASAAQGANGQASLPQQDPAQAELICPISGGKWSCAGPAGVFDVRIEAEGYAPRYVWDVNLKPGENSDLGQTQLQRALSVFGRAVRKDGSAPPGPCRATLLPDSERGGGPGSVQPDNPPPDEQSFTVPVSQQGYFQVVGVMHGNHSISVACPGASGFALLKVQPNGETRIDPPLVLEELTLDIAISPKMDPAGKPWKLTVDVTAPRLRRIADSSEAAADGHWTRHGLMTGSYRVAVSSSDGMQWLKQDFDLRPDTGPLALRLAAVRVAGKVLLNELPVKARLEFSNEDGGDPVTLNSDVSGRYAGLLPIAPDAKDTSWIVEAHVAHPETVRKIKDLLVPRVADGKTVPLDLELPNIPVRGIVVSEDGKPQKGAQVTFKADGGYQTATSSDDLGNFEMADLSPGRYNAVAQSDYGVSDPTAFTVNDTSENKLKLVMHPNLHIPFYVVAQDQEPISDAIVQVWIAPGMPQAFGHTNRDGVFKATLPPGTTEVGLTVGADDYAVNLVKMPVSSTPPANQSDSSQGQNSVTLHTDGGSLVLNYEPAEGTLDRSATLYLAHNGAIVDARTLAGWGTDQSGTSSDGPAEVDLIEPGDYALCVVTDPSQLADLWQGNTPQDRCSTGTVKQGQVLTLSPPSPH